MGVCDRRYYYPVINGLFKIKASDGDLVWEVRDTLEVSSVNCRNLCVAKGGDSIATGTFNGAFESKLLIVTEDADGLVESVVETGDSPVTIRADWGSNQSIGNPQIQTDGTDFYLQGATGSPARRTIRKYDADGNYIDGTQTLPSPSADTFANYTVMSPSEYVRTSFSSSSQYRLSRHSQFAGGAIATSASLFNTLLRNRQDGLVHDADAFYCTTGGATLYKIHNSSLVTLGSCGLTTDGYSTVLASAKDGYLFGAAGFFGALSSTLFSHSFVLINTGTMTRVWQRAGVFPFAGSSQVFDLDVCSSFAVAAGCGATSSVPETFQVKRLRLTDGATEWSVNLRSFGSLYASFLQPIAAPWGFEMPRVVISSDRSKIYVTGLLTAKASPSFTNEPGMAVICLDASNGSVLWSFCAGQTVVPSGNTVINPAYNVGTGMSLYDDGDYIYLSTVRCTSPKQR